ncbi:hypothetical protein JHK84_027961 [Glycine max]|nr:hypothetical protein JHK85_028368 [Glycine max]KAG5003707.1 hypothetical protein JHK86_027846 [Glycine max]KAG5151489.1 hypothetical protein JHK84_027961 [Glycine max]
MNAGYRVINLVKANVTNERDTKLCHRSFDPIIKPNECRPDIHVLGVRVSTKGSNAEAAVNPSLPNHAAPSKPTMGMNDRIYELGSLSPFVLVFAGHVALYCKIRKP